MSASLGDTATILIVDDNPENLDVLFQYFEAPQFRTLAAQNGDSALSQIEHVRPDLILLDILMPGIDGFETCRRLKKNSSTRDIPVIFLTALSEVEKKLKGFEVGGVDYITKPFQYEEVLARVNIHLTLRRQQQQLKGQTVALQEMNAQLEALNMKKDKFFSIVAHDLKSPFAGIIVEANLIKENIERWSKHDITRSADRLQESVHTLYAFIENLLSWSRFQLGVMSFSPQHVNIQFIVTRAVALLIHKMQQKEIDFENSIQDPILMCVDVNMVDTVFRNLLSNAVKFTESGGSIRISATEGENTVTFSVSDTGIGIPDDILKDLFHIDAKSSQLGTEGEQGTGLGLILCKEFIAQHGGALWVESDVGRGSTLVFTLPRHPS